MAGDRRHADGESGTPGYSEEPGGAGTHSDVGDELLASVARLKRVGFVNYFGPQRFGLQPKPVH